MTRCPNCKKLSKDDDFCSHCGAAVYADDGDFSGPDCSAYEQGHTHEKQSYSAPYTRNPAGGMKQPQAVKPKNSGCVTAIIIFIILMFVLPALFELIFRSCTGEYIIKPPFIILNGGF